MLNQKSWSLVAKCSPFVPRDLTRRFKKDVNYIHMQISYTLVLSQNDDISITAGNKTQMLLTRQSSFGLDDKDPWG